MSGTTPAAVETAEGVRVQKAVRQNRFAPPFDRVFPLQQAVEALSHMKANAHVGKIVLSI